MNELSTELRATVAAEFPRDEQPSAEARLASGQTVCTVTESGTRRCVTPEGRIVEKPASLILDPDEEG